MKDRMYDNMYAAEQVHWWFRAKREIVLALGQPYLRNSYVNNLVDFGCGCGAMLEELKAYGNVTGMDFSDRALHYCKQRFDGQLMRVDLSEPIARELESQYDFGLALDILEHIDNDLAAAKNLYSMLKSGGCCIITVPAYQWLWSKHDDNCMHKRRYNKELFSKVLNNAGFDLKYISYYNCILFFPAVIIRLISKALSIDKDSSIENHLFDSFFNRTLYHFFSSEKKIICKGRHFPFGLSLIALAKKGGAERGILLNDII